MENAKVGALIRALRTRGGLTQRALAERLRVTDKAVSKWERGLGCPDVSVLGELSGILGVRLEELLRGELDENEREAGNMKKTRFYVCPRCGNLLTASGEAAVSCCGMRLAPLEMKKAEPEERLLVELVENDYYVTGDHPMTKEHSVAFAALLTGDCLVLRRLYPEWDLQARLPRLAHGVLVWYCTRDGLFWQPV